MVAWTLIAFGVGIVIAGLRLASLERRVASLERWMMLTGARTLRVDPQNVARPSAISERRHAPQ